MTYVFLTFFCNESSRLQSFFQTPNLLGIHLWVCNSFGRNDVSSNLPSFKFANSETKTKSFILKKNLEKHVFFLYQTTHPSGIPSLMPRSIRPWYRSCSISWLLPWGYPVPLATRIITLPETNLSHLICRPGPKKNFIFQLLILRGYVGCQGG